MDVLSHALWSCLIYHKADTADQLLAVGLGVAPDLLAFAPMTIKNLVTGRMRGWMKADKTDSRNVTKWIPRWVYRVYDITHSIPVWLACFALWWWLAGKVPWPAFAWLIHIIVDIPTHTKKFFPTPFLWPISSFTVDGFSWAERWFMRLNYGSLALAYLLTYVIF